MRQLLAAVSDQLGLTDSFLALPALDKGARRFAPFVVGARHHRG
jgi:hypothetical protein